MEFLKQLSYLHTCDAFSASFLQAKAHCSLIEADNLDADAAIVHLCLCNHQFTPSPSQMISVNFGLFELEDGFF
jgi:hypothetical protein